ncbi:MAG: hypothetical protein FJ135_14535 [Deltaproteobacteria bacterium]|nr:hypothetical protein [Deltaproteobacteria bacterium]
MVWSMSKAVMILIILGGLLAAGCTGPTQYKNPSSQEESSPTYRALYPAPFSLDQGPSATSSGDE